MSSDKQYTALILDIRSPTNIYGMCRNFHITKDRIVFSKTQGMRQRISCRTYTHRDGNLYGEFFLENHHHRRYSDHGFYAHAWMKKRGGTRQKDGTYYFIPEEWGPWRP